MKKENLIKAVKDLNLILFNNDENSIPTDIDPQILQEKLKEASLWIYASDNLQENTVDVLRQLDWSASDFEDLKENQDPVPAFQRYAIGPYAKSEEPEPEPEPEPSAKEVEEIQADEFIKPEKKEEPKEYTEEAPPKKKEVKGPSAYGTALALMGPDPEMPLHELYELMKEQGFDLAQATGSIKTAHSIFRKVYRYLKDNGHIVEK
jgi:hypothetical protein